MTVVKVMAFRNRFSFSGNALKVIAVIAMMINHIAWIEIEEYSEAKTPLQIVSCTASGG